VTGLTECPVVSVVSGTFSAPRDRSDVCWSPRIPPGPPGPPDAQKCRMACAVAACSPPR